MTNHTNDENAPLDVSIESMENVRELHLHPYIVDDDSNVFTLQGIPVNESRLEAQQENIRNNVENLNQGLQEEFLQPLVNILLSEYVGELSDGNVFDLTLLSLAVRSLIYRINGMPHPLHDYVASDEFQQTYIEELEYSLSIIGDDT